jgi:biotin carboxyl carrier protein
LSKRYRVSTGLGEDFEFELVEKSRDSVVLRSLKTGRLYRIRVDHPGEKKLVLDINGVKRVVYINDSDGVYVDFERLPVTRVVQQSVTISKAEEKRVAKKPLEAPGLVTAPITGRVVEVKVAPGTSVKEGDVLLLMESMKMIIEVKSPYRGVVEEVYVDKNKPVNKGEPLLKIRLS